MQNEKLTLLLQRFASAAVNHFQAIENMDEKRANSCAAMIAGLYKSIVTTGEDGKKGLLMLTGNADPVIAGMAAVYSVRYNCEQSMATLKAIAALPGLLGFRAQTAVGRWEGGEWQGPEE